MIKKLLSSSLAGSLFFTNVFGLYAAQNNIWSERRKQNTPSTSTQYAALPLTQTSDPHGSALIPVPDAGSNLAALVTNTASSAHKYPTALTPYAQALSLQNGTIREFYAPPAENAVVKPLVVLIQDVHLNYEAQQNIAAILKAFGTQALQIQPGQPLSVGVEGAFQTFDFTRFRNFKNKQITKAVASYMLRENHMAAPSYIGITDPINSPVFYGIDDPKQYEANVAAYLASTTDKDTLQKQLNGKRSALNQKKATSLNADLRQFDAKRSAYTDGTLGLGDYLQYLSHCLRGDPEASLDLSVEQFLAAYNLEKSLNFGRIETQRNRAVRALSEHVNKQELNKLLTWALAYQNGRISFGEYYRILKFMLESKSISLSSMPDFDNYIRYILLSDGIKAEQLFDATGHLESQVEAMLCRTPAEKELLQQSRRLDLMLKLTDFALTPDEWTEYQKSSATSAAPELRSPLRNFEKFYEAADIRSHLMMDRILSSAAPKSPVVACVVGGFHAPLMARLLKEKSFGYAIVQPKLTKIEGSGSDYLSFFNREKTPLDRLFEGKKLFVAVHRVMVGDEGIPGHPVPGNVENLALQSGLHVLTGDQTKQTGTGTDATLLPGGAAKVTVQTNEETKTFTMTPVSEETTTSVNPNDPEDMDNGGQYPIVDIKPGPSLAKGSTLKLGASYFRFLGPSILAGLVALAVTSTFVPAMAALAMPAAILALVWGVSIILFWGTLSRVFSISQVAHLAEIKNAVEPNFVESHGPMNEREHNIREAGFELIKQFEAQGKTIVPFAAVVGLFSLYVFGSYALQIALQDPISAFVAFGILFLSTIYILIPTLLTPILGLFVLSANTGETAGAIAHYYHNNLIVPAINLFAWAKRTWALKQFTTLPLFEGKLTKKSDGTMIELEGLFDHNQISSLIAWARERGLSRDRIVQLLQQVKTTTDKPELNQLRDEFSAILNLENDGKLTEAQFERKKTDTVNKALSHLQDILETEARGPIYALFDPNAKNEIDKLIDFAQMYLEGWESLDEIEARLRLAKSVFDQEKKEGKAVSIDFDALKFSAADLENSEKFRQREAALDKLFELFSYRSQERFNELREKRAAEFGIRNDDEFWETLSAEQWTDVSFMMTRLKQLAPEARLNWLAANAASLDINYKPIVQLLSDDQPAEWGDFIKAILTARWENGVGLTDHTFVNELPTQERLNALRQEYAAEFGIHNDDEFWKILSEEQWTDVSFMMRRLKQLAPEARLNWLVANAASLDINYRPIVQLLSDNQPDKWGNFIKTIFKARWENGKGLTDHIFAEIEDHSALGLPGVLAFPGDVSEGKHEQPALSAEETSNDIELAFRQVFIYVDQQNATKKLLKSTRKQTTTVNPRLLGHDWMRSKTPAASTLSPRDILNIKMKAVNGLVYVQPGLAKQGSEESLDEVIQSSFESALRVYIMERGISLLYPHLSEESVREAFREANKFLSLDDYSDHPLNATLNGVLRKVATKLDHQPTVEAWAAFGAYLSRCRVFDKKLPVQINLQAALISDQNFLKVLSLYPNPTRSTFARFAAVRELFAVLNIFGWDTFVRNGHTNSSEAQVRLRKIGLAVMTIAAYTVAALIGVRILESLPVDSSMLLKSIVTVAGFSISLLLGLVSFHYLWDMSPWGALTAEQQALLDVVRQANAAKVDNQINSELLAKGLEDVFVLQNNRLSDVMNRRNASLAPALRPIISEIRQKKSLAANLALVAELLKQDPEQVAKDVKPLSTQLENLEPETMVIETVRMSDTNLSSYVTNMANKAMTGTRLVIYVPETHPELNEAGTIAYHSNAGVKVEIRLYKADSGVDFSAELSQGLVNIKHLNVINAPGVTLSAATLDELKNLQDRGPGFLELFLFLGFENGEAILKRSKLDELSNLDKIQHMIEVAA